MGDTGFLPFQGSLDPRAQEFHPTILPFLGPPPPPHPLPPPPVYALHPFPFMNPHHAPQFPPLPPPPPPPPPPQTSSPTRTVLLSSVPGDVTEGAVRLDMEEFFGEVRAVQMERLPSDGVVVVHFYDLRSAERALAGVQAQHMNRLPRPAGFFEAQLMLGHLHHHGHPLPPVIREPGLVAGRAVWAQFIVPACNSLHDGYNQGTLVVFNLNPNVSSPYLKEIFQVFGEVKELRETPYKRRQRFIEFYDVRDAAMALKEMDGKELLGRRMVIEFSRPGGLVKKFFNAIGLPPKPPGSLIDSPTSAHEHGNNNNFNDIKLPPLLIDASMESLSLGGRPGKAEKSNASISKRNWRRNINAGVGQGSMSAFCAKQQRGSGNGGGGSSSSSGSGSKGSRKGNKQGSMFCKKLDARFLINENATVEDIACNDPRTTVMIKNIPNKYSQQLLLSMLDNHCTSCNDQIADGDDQPLSSYDFVYLPIDFNNKCNVGYGFVNMTSPEAILRLYKAFHHRHWEVFNSRKICEITYARVQGLEALKDHFRSSKFPCDSVHYLPVVFSPPRDGKKQVADPIPLVAHYNKQQELILLLQEIDPTTQPAISSSSEMDGGDCLKSSSSSSNSTETGVGGEEGECGAGSRNGGDL